MCICFVYLFAFVINYIYSDIKFLKSGSYDTMMSAAIAVINHCMMELRKEQENGAQEGVDIHEYPLINIKIQDWITLKDTREKVMELLWRHECVFRGGRNNKERACLDPVTLILVHKNARKMIRRMLPEVCFYHYPCVQIVIKFVCFL